MRLIITIAIITLSLFLFPKTILGQQLSNENIFVRLTKADSIYASKLPQLKLPKRYKLGKVRELPSELNNSLLPFFRPTFSQNSFWNCGQAAGVGYNFTYELNAARGLNGNTLTNQYSPNFTYNFMNSGEGWGVSYFNSFDAIKKCGNPNLSDYGGLFNGGDTRWMSGFELYENAMQNRIENVYAIDVGTPEGLTTLKYWLLDHLNGSEFGGVANFYFQFGWTGNLPPESPDTGFPVIIEAGEFAGHALTIVGFNDSIRYDINNDGQFTNDIDITEDGIVDMKDWEIGGLRYINSSLANNGAGYLMYRTLAFEYGSGGLWNQQMHVLTVKENYEPLVNLRLKIAHNSRNKLKVIAGISSNTTDNYPEYTMDFPIFNYQGGDQYMQGLDTSASHKTLELALDISPLLTHVSTDHPVKFFVQIAENDKYNMGEGEILYYSVVDRTDGFSEVVCNEVPQNINNNAVTTLQITYTPVFDKVKIITEELPGISPGTVQIVQLEAESGYPPYSWEVLKPYTFNTIQNDFPQISDERLAFENNTDARVEVSLPFNFPYYGDTIQNITIYLDGFIMFNDEPYPYPYYVGEESLIKREKVIAPFMSDMMLNYEDVDGVWINKYYDYVGIRWKVSAETSYGSSDVNFSVLLYPNGKIETHYGSMDYPQNRLWAVGISSGDNTNYTLNQFGHHLDEVSNTAFEYSPPELLTDINVNQLGELSIMINDESQIYPLTVQVKDDKGIIDVASYNISSSGLTFNYHISPGNNNTIEYNEISELSLYVNNNSSNTLENVHMNLSSLSTYVQLSDTLVSIGTLEPQQSIEISNATDISVLPQVPDKFNSIIRCNLTTDDKHYTSNINLTVNAPDFRIIDTQIIDNNNNVLYPGETATIKFSIQNGGHARSMDVTCKLSDEYTHVYIPPQESDIIALNPGDTTSVEFTIAAAFSTPMGTEIQLDLAIYNSEYDFKTIATNIRVGHLPVLIIDLNPAHKSGPPIKTILNNLGLQNTYTISVPYNLDDYLSVFVCLGGFFNNYYLTEYEGTVLADYLQSTGKIYMEGSATWGSDPQTSLHNLFNLIADPPGNYFILDTIVGVNESYTKDMIFNIEEQYSYVNYFLHPDEGASTFMISNNDESSGVVIANQTENYSTIGSNILFGALIDTDTINTKEDYLVSILDFFDIKKYIYVDTPELESHGRNINIHVYPNPVKDKLTIQFFNTFQTPSLYQIMDIHGKLIKEESISEIIVGNSTSTDWNCKDKNGKNLPNGIYLIRYISGNQSVTKKIILN